MYSGYIFDKFVFVNRKKCKIVFWKIFKKVKFHYSKLIRNIFITTQIKYSDNVTHVWFKKLRSIRNFS